MHALASWLGPQGGELLGQVPAPCGGHLEAIQKLLTVLQSLLFSGGSQVVVGGRPGKIFARPPPPEQKPAKVRRSGWLRQVTRNQAKPPDLRAKTFGRRSGKYEDGVEDVDNLNTTSGK